MMSSSEGDKPVRQSGILGQFRRDASGITAIEFAMVATPFLMLLYGTIGVGLYFFTTFTLENAVEQAARLVRTGQVQTSGMTAEQFKTEVCTRAPGFIDCTSKMRVGVQTYNDFSNVTYSANNCLDATGKMITSTSYAAGGASSVVLVWVCYEWDFSRYIPFLNLSDMSNGSRLIQAATAFRTEPYN